MDLFDEQRDNSRSSGKLGGLKVNKEFAAAFDKRKRGEELSKLHDKYGSGAESDEASSTSYSSEDSEAELATPAVDVAILRTLARIRKGDASIYETGRNIFDEEEGSLPVASTSKLTNGPKRKDKSAPLSLSAYQRNTLLAGGDADEDGERGRPTPKEEDEALRAEVKAAFADAAPLATGEDGGSDDDLLVPRLKTRDEEQQEAADYRSFLKEQAGSDALDLAEEEKFLRDYIMNRGWLDRDSSHIPTHEEILEGQHSTKGKGKALQTGSNGFQPLIEDDDEFDERADDFETKYNFRFEQSGGEAIKTHSRNVDDSVRRLDTSRREKRKRTADEKVKRSEEKARLKAEERAERDRLRSLQDAAKQDRLAKLKEAVGAGVVGVEALDLDSDFDPAEHDRRMANMFDDHFYGDAITDADGKPVWEESEGEEEHLPYVKAGDDDIYDPSVPIRKESKTERKKKRKQEAAEAVESAPAQNDGERDDLGLREQYNAYFDRFEHEDIVDDEPTHFRYAPVDASAFELTPEEILLATDAELNTYVGLSKLATYRSATPAKKRARRMKELKGILAKRQWGQDVSRDEILHASDVLQRRRMTETNGLEPDTAPKKRKGKRQREAKARQTAGLSDAS